MPAKKPDVFEVHRGFEVDATEIPLPDDIVRTLNRWYPEHVNGRDVISGISLARLYRIIREHGA